MREWNLSNLGQRRSGTPDLGFSLAKSRLLQPGTAPFCPAAGSVPDSSIPPSVWAADSLGYTPDPLQVKLLDLETRRIAVCASRQLGKTQVAATKALYIGLTRPNSLILIFCPVGRQAGELLGRIREFALTLGFRQRSDGNNPRSLVLPNGSRFVALSDVPATARSYANVAVVIVDEAAFVDDAIFHAVSPMLAVSNGAMWVLSTPDGQTGRFYDLCTKPSPSWDVFFAPATECPRISPEFLALEREFLGDALYRQEYECAFIASKTQFLDRDLVAAASVPQLVPGKPLPSATELFVGVDIGKRVDHSAIVVLALDWFEGQQSPVTMARELHPRIRLLHAETLPLGSAYLDLPARLKSIFARCQGAHAPYTPQVTMAMDATGEGTLIELVRHSKGLEKVWFHPVTITGGLSKSDLKDSYTGIPRPDLLTRLRSLFERSLIHLPLDAPGFGDLEHELVHFRSDGRQREHDDLVFACALAVWFLVERRKEVLLPKR
jgi:hypothetical protein